MTIRKVDVTNLLREQVREEALELMKTIEKVSATHWNALPDAEKEYIRDSAIIARNMIRAADQMLRKRAWTPQE